MSTISAHIAALVTAGTLVMMMQNYPNPAKENTTFKYRVAADAKISLQISDINGKIVDKPIRNKNYDTGTYEYKYDVTKLTNGTYLATMDLGSQTMQTIKFSVFK